MSDEREKVDSDEAERGRRPRFRGTSHVDVERVDDDTVDVDRVDDDTVDVD